MRLPSVTVAIPSYNRPAFLREALASVLKQDFQDFEVLVLDDASPCDIAAIVGEFGDPRIRLCRQRANVGVILKPELRAELRNTITNEANADLAIGNRLPALMKVLLVFSGFIKALHDFSGLCRSLGVRALFARREPKGYCASHAEGADERPAGKSKS